MYTSAAPLRARSGGVSQNDALRFDVLPVFDVIRIGGPPVLATCSRPGGGEKANFGVGPIPRDRDDRAPFATRLRAGHPPRAFPHRQPKFAICASAAKEATTRVVGGLAFPLIASREIRNPGGDSSHATPRDGIRECAYQLAFLSSMHLPTLLFVVSRDEAPDRQFFFVPRLEQVPSSRPLFSHFTSDVPRRSLESEGESTSTKPPSFRKEQEAIDYLSHFVVQTPLLLPSPPPPLFRCCSYSLVRRGPTMPTV